MTRMLVPLLCAAAMLLAVACAAAFGDVTIQPPTEPVPVATLIGLRVSGAVPLSTKVLVRDDSATAELGLLDDGTSLVVFKANQPGWYTVLAVASVDDIGWCPIQVGNAPPPPVPPIPPPPPPPQPGPLLAVLIYEQDPATTNLTMEQRAILTDLNVRKYLDSHSQKIDGHPAYRFLDKDADVAHLAPALRSLFDAGVSSDKTPWLILENASGRYEGPWPADAAAMLELLRKYGGE
jgi:hypothetical protein